MKEHDRWLLARSTETCRPAFQLEPARACRSRRRASNPIRGSTGQKLKVTTRAAQDLVAELDVREMTGKGRYRPRR
jgi:hypothetical protein